mgnify:CR=1 FL=1
MSTVATSLDTRHRLAVRPNGAHHGSNSQRGSGQNERNPKNVLGAKTRLNVQSFIDELNKLIPTSEHSLRQRIVTTLTRVEAFGNAFVAEISRYLRSRSEKTTLERVIREYHKARRLALRQ